MPPLLSEQAAYSKHLFIQGYPLWSPDPVLLPRGLQRVGLRIGDVGTVDERGRFDVFFNILNSSAEDTNSPPIIPPIEENSVRCSSEDISPREVVSSPKTSWDAEELDAAVITGVSHKVTQYGATLSNDGAHIILPQGAQSFELGLQQRRLFEDYARKHGADWLDRFRDQLGWPRSNSLCLLTGFYQTCSWSIASFERQAAARSDPVGVHCTLREIDEYFIRDDSFWQPTGRFSHKFGPTPDRQGQINLTVFIRGFMITPNPNLFSLSFSGKYGMLGISTRSNFPNIFLGNSITPPKRRGPPSNVRVQHVPHVSQALHPSEIINLYMLSKERPRAKFAVTHDSQWIAMLKEGQPRTLNGLKDNIQVLVQQCYSIAMENEVVYLREKDASTIGIDVKRLNSPLYLSNGITQYVLNYEHPGPRVVNKSIFPDTTDLPVAPPSKSIRNSAPTYSSAEHKTSTEKQESNGLFLSSFIPPYDTPLEAAESISSLMPITPLRNINLLILS